MLVLSCVLSLLIFLDTFTVTFTAETIHDYSKVLLEDADKSGIDDDIENSLWIEKDGIIFNGLKNFPFRRRIESNNTFYNDILTNDEYFLYLTKISIESYVKYSELKL